MFTFEFFKFKFQNRLKPKNLHFWDLFETNCLVAAKPKEKLANIIADSEPCIKYKDLVT